MTKASFLFAVLLVACHACSSPELVESIAPPSPDSGLAIDTGSPSIIPYQQQEPCNGLDDDEDGQVDEGCLCQRGETQPCYPRASAPNNTGLHGVCAMGIQACEGNIGGEFDGRWGQCVDAELPQDEICGDGIDQDCDGHDLECPPCVPDCTNKACGDDGCGGSCGEQEIPCETAFGTCSAQGTKTCTGSTYAACTAPDPRTSNCTGKVCGDDGCGGFCGDPPHACQKTLQTKSVESWSFKACLGCCQAFGHFLNEGLPNCPEDGAQYKDLFYGGFIAGKPPTRPPYCYKEEVQDYPPCAGIIEPAGALSSINPGQCGTSTATMTSYVEHRYCTQ